MKQKQLTDKERYMLFWREVVYQAMRDLLCPEIEQSSEEDRAEAFDWVYSDSEQMSSFLWACGEAGLSAEELRSELRKRGIA